MKLLMKMIMIACAHVGVFFLLYARQNVLLGYFADGRFLSASYCHHVLLAI
jgi:hypothetical protein